MGNLWIGLGECMIEVDSFEQVLHEGSSKGNQHKFYKDGQWVKLDNPGCTEGLAEEFVSGLESCIYGYPHVEYRSSMVLYNDVEYLGCCSSSMFGNPGISFIPLRRLFVQAGIPLNIFIKDVSVERNIRNVVEVVGRLIGLDILGYLGRLLLLDSLILNEDRHYMNLGVCWDSQSGQYLLAPCFDNGSSLFCTNWTYRKRKTLDENIISAMSVARPFSKFFDKQVQALLTLGITPLVLDRVKFNWFYRNYHNSLYSDELNGRVKQVLSRRLESTRGSVYVWG